jgi:hypothetical protein
VIHDPALLERLSAFAPEPFDGEVFRATRRSLDPLAASTSGGRWVPKGLVRVLNTSLLREGALAEISYHWSQLTPRPSKPAFLHRLAVRAERRLRLLRTDLEVLDVDLERYESVNYHRTQEIGAAVAFLECDGLIVPSARWSCENLVVFTDNHLLTSGLEVLSSGEIDWQAWSQDAGFFNRSGLDVGRGRATTERTRDIGPNQRLSDSPCRSPWPEGHEHSSVAVAVGAFADPGFPPPQDSVYDCRRHSWVQLPPGTTTYDEDPA